MREWTAVFEFSSTIAFSSAVEGRFRLGGVSLCGRLFGVTSRLFGVRSLECSLAATATLRLAVLTTARARDAKCSVESDSWSDSTEGETVQSMTQRAEPPNDSLSRCVSFEFR